MKKSGFTLGEILIAMSLIGAIAAMTLPNLDYRFKSGEYATKIKKFYSKMDSAISEMETEDGSAKDIKEPANSAAAYEWYMENVDSHMGHQFVDKDNQIIYFKDGSNLNIAKSKTLHCTEFLYDVNSTKKPNVLGKDKFMFLICYTDSEREDWFGTKDFIWGTYGKGFTSKTTTRASVIQKCASDANFCSRLLELDDWEFKKDYPFSVK